MLLFSFLTAVLSMSLMGECEALSVLAFLASDPEHSLKKGGLEKGKLKYSISMHWGRSLRM